MTSSSDPASPRDRLRNDSVIRGPDSARPGEYDSRPRTSSNASPTKPSTYDRRDDLGGHDRKPGHTNLPLDEPSRLDLDRAGPPLGRPSTYPDSRDDELRGPGPREQRFYRERRDSRDRDRDNDRDWDRGRGRDRREYRPAMTNAPRPPLEDRHYEPNYGPDDSFPRRSNTGRLPPDDVVNVDSKRPPPHPPTRIDDHRGRGPISPPDRHIRPGVAVDDRDLPLARAPPADSSHSARLPLIDDRAARPPPAVRDSDVRPSLPADAARGPPPLLDDRTARPPVPLEDRITHGPPPQDRVTQSRADDRLLRRPSLEERITHAPTVPPPQDDRPARSGPADRTARAIESAPRPPLQDDRDRLGRPDERPLRAGPPSGDRYIPVHPHRGNYVPPVGPSSVVHDDPRPPPRVPPSPPATRNEYRPLPPRAMSRDRELRPAYRTEPDRAYSGDRAMDVDLPRSDTRRSSPLPNRALSPPLRGKSVYPPPPPLHAEYADSDRRYAGDRRDYNERTFNGPDDDYYSRTDRGPRGHAWEERERERKITVADSPPIRPYDNALSRSAPRRPSTAHPDDRTYPPTSRDFDRERYPPPPSETPISRVRPRSPSPPVRRVDDDRPPLKRVREEPAYNASYYTPQPRRLSVGGPADDYPNRPLPPPRPPSRASYYDSRPVPVSPPARAPGAPTYERDYPRATDVGPYASAPSTYERPRSPRAPPGGGYNNARAGYTRPDPRDDRRYMPPPPRAN